MAHTITFDTLAFVKKLEKAGIESEKSEAIAEAVADVFDNNLNSVTTKQDFSLLKNEIEKGFAEVDAKLAKLKTEIIMWVVGLLFGQTALLVSIIKFMH